MRVIFSEESHGSIVAVRTNLGIVSTLFCFSIFQGFGCYQQHSARSNISTPERCTKTVFTSASSIECFIVGCHSTIVHTNGNVERVFTHHVIVNC